MAWNVRVPACLAQESRKLCPGDMLLVRHAQQMILRLSQKERRSAARERRHPLSVVMIDVSPRWQYCA
jgi:hypothetical protein